MSFRLPRPSGAFFLPSEWRRVMVPSLATPRRSPPAHAGARLGVWARGLPQPPGARFSRTGVHMRRLFAFISSSAFVLACAQDPAAPRVLDAAAAVPSVQGSYQGTGVATVRTSTGLHK